MRNASGGGGVTPKLLTKEHLLSFWRILQGLVNETKLCVTKPPQSFTISTKQGYTLHVLLATPCNNKMSLACIGLLFLPTFTSWTRLEWDVATSTKESEYTDNARRATSSTFNAEYSTFVRNLMNFIRWRCTVCIYHNDGRKNYGARKSPVTPPPSLFSRPCTWNYNVSGNLSWTTFITHWY